MKKRLLLSMLLALSTLTFLSGCATSGGRAGKVAKIAGEAAYVATSRHLEQFPTHKVRFESVAMELRQMEKAGTYTNKALYDSIGKLPISELRSEEAIIAFNDAKVTFESAETHYQEFVERRDFLSKVVPAIRKGIERALP